MSYLQLGRSLFWFAVVLVGVTTFVVIEPGYTLSTCSPLVQTPDTGFFGASLNVTLSIISLVFIVVIFLVQNANQEYSSRLSGMILREPHFLLTIVFILAGSIFSVSGGYFSLGAPLTLLSYAFSVATVILVGALIAFAAYFINIKNIVDYVTNNIEKTISSSRIYRWQFWGLGKHDDEYIDKLTSDTQLIVSTCIKGIEKNNEPVVASCLSSITQITERFLDETGNMEVDDNYLQEVNDQFRFIASTALDDYSRQKYSEKVAEAAGDIGIAVTGRRKLGPAGAHWAGLLEEIFADSLNFDRTSAPPVCIKKLGEMSVAAIEEGSDSFRNDAARSCVGKLHSISHICISNRNIYTANLVGNILLQYQNIYCSYIKNIFRGKSVDRYDVNKTLENLSNLILSAKENFDGVTEMQAILSNVFGLESFPKRIIDIFSNNVEIEENENNILIEELSKIVRSLDIISNNKLDKNHYLIYQGYTQTLFALIGVSQTLSDHTLVKELIYVRAKMVKNEYEKSIDNEQHVDGKLNEEISDFNALLVYYYKDQCKTLAELIEPLAVIYSDLDQKYNRSNRYVDQNLQKLYGQLKLVGAWINSYCDVKAEAPKLWDVLVRDFSGVRSGSPTLGSRMANYGYPIKPSSLGRGWSLRPDRLWAYTGFQQEIARELQPEDEEVYLDFHDLLKRKNQST